MGASPSRIDMEQQVHPEAQHWIAERVEDVGQQPGRLKIEAANHAPLPPLPSPTTSSKSIRNFQPASPSVTSYHSTTTMFDGLEEKSDDVMRVVRSVEQILDDTEDGGGSVNLSLQTLIRDPFYQHLFRDVIPSSSGCATTCHHPENETVGRIDTQFPSSTMTNRDSKAALVSPLSVPDSIVTLSTEFFGFQNVQVPSSVTEDNSTFSCLICLDDVVNIEMFLVPECTHTLCRHCAHNYVMSCINSCNFPIFCPLCKADKAVAPLKNRAVPDPSFATSNDPNEDAIIKNGRNQTRRRFSWFRPREPSASPSTTSSQTIVDIEVPPAKTIIEIPPTLILSLLTPQVSAQYEHLTLTHAIDTDREHFHRCPTPACKGVVYVDWEDINMEGVRKAKCPVCDTTWCARCRVDTAHEGMSCKDFAKWTRKRVRKLEKHMKRAIKRGDFEGFASAVENCGSPERTDTATGAIDVRFEEMLFREGWQRCPKCTMVVCKNQGCNKMSCQRCNTNFCILCGKELHAKRPYLHYAKRFTKCYKKLFDETPPTPQPE